MARSSVFTLRLTIVALGVAMLLFHARPAHAQDFQPAPQSGPQSAGPPAGYQTAPQAPAGPIAAPTMPVESHVFGYNPGQGMPHNETAPSQPSIYAPPSQQPFAQGPPQQAYAQAAPQPYGYAPNQAAQPVQPYGYAPMMAQPQPQQPYGFAPVSNRNLPPQQPYGYVSTPVGNYAQTSYGTQQSADPQADYQQPFQAQRQNADYRLGPGDKVRVSVFGEADLSGEYQVDGSGLVRLPLIGTVRAGGLNAPTLEGAIAGALGNGYLKSPRVNVEIITYRPFYIIGAVNKPGEYAYVDHMNALNAVALAGGFLDSAVQSTVYVRHEGDTEERAVPTDELNHVSPGDVIRVKTTIFWDAVNVLSPLGPTAFAAAAIR